MTRVTTRSRRPSLPPTVGLAAAAVLLVSACAPIVPGSAQDRPRDRPADHSRPAALGPGTRPTAPSTTTTSPTSAPTPSPTGTPVRVFVVGDSAAYGLHAEHPPSRASGVLVRGSTQLGCDVLGPGQFVDGRVQPQEPVCRGWAAQWARDVARQRPDVAVLMPGNSFLFDRIEDGQWLGTGTPAHTRFLTRWLARSVAALEVGADSVVVTTIPCYDKPENGLDGSPAVVNDPSRLAAANAAVRAFVDDHPAVSLIDLGARICPGGRYQERVDGVRLRKDGVHWTSAGAAYVWRFLTPRLERTAGRSG